MPEPMRRRLERGEDRDLAPWALRSAGATRRYRLEDAGRAFDYRSQFQRDRDRVVYSRAFRRLRQKAVAGMLPAYEDHRRNRLTHTLEVAQLARTIGRALTLNEDLIEAVALGHDLGQPPFGPPGARALDDVLSGRLDGRGGPGLGDRGGFARAWQALRVVDRLEKRYDHPGLNLTDAVREGLVKSAPEGRAPSDELAGTRPGLAPPFEVQVVRLADRLATVLSDLDDALSGGALDLGPVERLEAVVELRRKLGETGPRRAARFARINAIHRGLTHLFATATILTAERTLRAWAERHAVREPADYQRLRDAHVQGGEIALAPRAERMLGEIERELLRHVHRGFEADQVEARARHVLLGLFAAYHADPTLLPDHVLLRFKELAGGRFLRDLPRDDVEVERRRRYAAEPRFVRLLADHLAAMTDGLALAEHARLTDMGAVPIPSAEQLRRERDDEAG